MAREYAQIKTNIWIDDDFLDLGPGAQHLYLLLCSQMKLSFCGALEWHPGRLAQLAAGWTVDDVKEAATELSERLYIVIDEETDEMLVRSFIRNDGLLGSPNIAKAMLRAFSEVSSRTLRGVLVYELTRLFEENPALKGWGVCAELLSKRSIDPSDLPPYNPSRNPSINPSPAGGGNPFDNPSPAPYSLLPTPYTLTPDSPAGPGAYSADFEKVWALYPLKRDKKAAGKAFIKASKTAGIGLLVAAVVRYRDDPNREPRFTKHFSSWLNGECWDDEPIPSRATNAKPTTSDKMRSTIEQAQAMQDRMNQQDHNQLQIGA